MIFPSVSDFPSKMPQPDLSDMIPNTASGRKKMADNKKYLDQRSKGWETNIALMRSPTINESTNKQIPGRDSINDVTRRSKIDGGKSKLLGAFPQSGTGRHEPNGLESVVDFAPRPIAPLPDYFYPALNTTIPNVA